MHQDQSILQVLRARIANLISFPTRVSEEYRTEILDYAKKGRDERFLNGTNEHAAFVTGVMLDRLGEDCEALIYSKALEPAFYAEVLQSSKCPIRLILDDESGVRRIEALPTDVRRRIQYRFAAFPSEKGHFIVARDAFRYESGDSADELFVVCNFNEPATAQKLRNRFSSLWDNPRRF